jgi:hypothetical protein
VLESALDYNTRSNVMAKGQQRQPKEKKKPKAEDKMKPVSGYKSQYGGGGSAPSNTLGSKKS